jgi:methylenetetrahydrofolate dehydrogenase (NADP+)/methenyltetrahydrofolate cyclohydrolase
MQSNIMDGRKVADHLLEELRPKMKLLENKGITPKLVIILLGDDGASLSYIRQKTKACEKLGLQAEQINLPVETSEDDLIELIEKLNADKSAHGILVQLPLPAHISTPLVIRAIDPKKDVDGFTAYNLGKMFLGTEFEDLPPCTPLGVMRLLDFYEVDLKGMDAVVVGASNIVGKPMATMLLNRGATVSVCHILTKDLKSYTGKADLVIVAVGKANLIKEDMVKEGVILIDVGCNSVDGKLCGDSDFAAIAPKAKLITPVPGGVGPMTVACLLENTINAALRINGF